MDYWKDKVAVVTGAGVGIGARVAEDLVKLGMIVVGFDYTDEKFNNMQKLSIQCIERCYSGYFAPFKCDVSKDSEILDTFSVIEKTYGGVDVLINNAAICRDGMISTGSTEDFKDVLDTNLFGLTLCTRQAVQSIRKRNTRGHIININSICGHYMPPLSAPKFNLYIATKHALTAITEILRQEFRYLEANIKVTSVSPGLVRTDLFEASKSTIIDKEFVENNPMLSSKDVSDAVLYTLGTPPQVQIHEIMMHALHEIY